MDMMLPNGDVQIAENQPLASGQNVGDYYFEKWHDCIEKYGNMKGVGEAIIIGDATRFCNESVSDRLTLAGTGNTT
ncbi:MAG: hypothetical protein ACREBC_25430 [Pyrinomonadaceae bacterium]